MPAVPVTLRDDEHAVADLADEAFRWIANGREADALPLFERLRALQPDEPAHALNLGNARLACGDAVGALRAFDDAGRAGDDSLALWLGLGLAHLAMRHFREAGTWLRRAYRSQPHAADVALAWTQYLVEMEAFEEARQCLSRMDATPLSRDQRRSAAWLHAQAGREDIALRLFDDSLAADPDDDLLRLQYALLLERLNRLDEAGQQIAAIRDPHAQPGLSALCRARWLRRTGRLDDALAEARRGLSAPRGDEMDAQLRFEAARLHDLRTEADAAMAALAQAHACARRALSVRHPGIERTEPLGWLAQRLAAPAPAHWRRPVQDGLPRDPVFLVGFPRSGTTLLQQMLAMQPALRVAEEVPVLEDVIARLQGEAMDRDLFAVLDALTVPARTALRRSYWQGMAQRVPDDGRRLVDKYPLSLTRITHIARLFPQSHTVCLLRHPCDVVLSCHMQAFGANGGALAFASLASAARTYARVMAYWETQRPRVDCAIHVLRYEDLVTDPQPTLRRLCDVLALPWSDDIEGFHRRAHDRGTRIRTPSYAQVARPLNADAIGRWTRYRRHFDGEPMALLAPWIARYGYAVD
jgi:tetratricopeptide (TPR) repeat protein